jgi:hypothetical protein
MNPRGLIWTLVLLALPAPGAWADESAPALLEVWSIRATTSHEKVSPELRELAAALKKQFKYTGFTLAERDRGRAALGNEFKADLPQRYRVEITPKARADNRITLRIVVSRKRGDKYEKRVETTVTVKQNAFIPIGCGSLAGGDQLIIAVRAR